MSDLAKSNIAAIALLLYGYSAIATAEFPLYEKNSFKLSTSFNSAVGAYFTKKHELRCGSSAVYAVAAPNKGGTQAFGANKTEQLFEMIFYVNF